VSASNAATGADRIIAVTIASAASGASGAPGGSLNASSAVLSRRNVFAQARQRAARAATASRSAGASVPSKYCTSVVCRSGHRAEPSASGAARAMAPPRDA
jgi:hypothetical protein